MKRFLIHFCIWIFWGGMLSFLFQKQSYLRREHFSRQDLKEMPILQTEKAEVFYAGSRLAVAELSTSLKKLGRMPTQFCYLKFRLGLYFQSEKFDIEGKGYILTKLEGEPLRARIEVKANEKHFLILGIPEQERFQIQIFYKNNKEAALVIPFADILKGALLMLPELTGGKADAFLESAGFKLGKIESADDLSLRILEYPAMDVLMMREGEYGSKEH